MAIYSFKYFLFILYIYIYRINIMTEGPRKRLVKQIDKAIALLNPIKQNKSEVSKRVQIVISELESIRESI